MPVRTGKRRIVLVLEAIIMFCWTASVCARTDSYEVVYLLCGVLAFCGFLLRIIRHDCSSLADVGVWRWGLVGLMSLAAICSNYPAYTSETWTASIVLRCLMLGSGVIVFRHVIYFCETELSDFFWRRDERKRHSVCFFFLPFFIIAAVDLLYLFLCNYPGTFTIDSREQLTQAVERISSNHHPACHTAVVAFWVRLGLYVFGDINAAAALYSVFQTLFMAACFSFGLLTLYQLGLSRKCVAVCLVWIVIMPYNIEFSVTEWKDILFGGTVLLFIVSLFRIMKGVGRSRALNYVSLAIGALGFALMRNNGWLALLGSFVVFAGIQRKKHTPAILILLVVLVVSYILKGPVLDSLGITKSPVTESLSIPIQQIARVIAEGKPLTDEQSELINQLIDMDSIPALYNPILSDPVKYTVAWNQKYLEEHMGEYLRLWADIGLKYPLDYVKAWIDQTRGYWNGGYEYWIWAPGVYPNDLGLVSSVRCDALANAVTRYFTFFERGQFTRLFLSIGLTDWLVFLLGAFNLRRGDREKAFLSVPVAMIIGTLLVATPVFAEFRYAYAAFTCLPFLLFMTFARDPNAGTGGMWSEIRASSEERENG